MGKEYDAKNRDPFGAREYGVKTLYIRETNVLSKYTKLDLKHYSLYTPSSSFCFAVNIG